MSIQISLRLSDEIVRDLDSFVAQGTYRSRATAVERALAREFRRALAERDAEILRTTPPDEDLEAFVAWSSDHPVPLG